jgi:hypothetical protein
MKSSDLKMAMLEQERAEENVLKRLEDQVVCVYVSFFVILYGAFVSE